MIPVSNAAGTVKLIEQARKLAKAPVDEIVLGSYTIEERTGNGGKIYEPPLNALGLPNPGSTYLAEFRDELSEMEQDIVVSIAAETVQDFAVLAAVFDWAFALEINLGCPNRWTGAIQNRIMSFDPMLVERVIEDVIEASKYAFQQIRVKLSPYSDPMLLREIADICVTYRVIVVASNTFPNGWLRGWGENGPAYGGVSGLREVALGQVRQFKAAGVEHVIGVGGIRTGQDILDFEAAGAGMVQMASRYLEGGEDPDVFVNLLNDALFIEGA